MKLRAAIGFAFVLLLLNTAYIGAFAEPTIFYMGNVLLHVGLGALLFLLGVRYLSRTGALVALIVFGTGAFLTWRGAVTPNQKVLWAHIAAGLAVIALAAVRFPRLRTAAMVLTIGGAALFFRPQHEPRIVNPTIVPVSMEEEGAGPKSPFWPSSSRTNVGGTIPSDFFMDSKLCGECHKDAYEQWNSSMHHFASFNNQFYRKSVEYMQDATGTKGSKWCAGCHDHAVFFNGRFERPIKEQVDTPEAQNGLGCVSCHSISNVDSSMGNGGFTIEYPPLHELASSRNRYIRALDNFLTYLDPEPHRKTFMKPFMRKDSSEFCSTCHKVHLDIPVNNYRWQRGFNDYDNWQASGVSGQGARSFYYPPKSQTCTDCHMPITESHDPGSRDGKIHSHRFAAANTAVAHVNNDKVQMTETEKFLKSGFITVDLFAATPIREGAATETRRRGGDAAPQLSTTFATGEEAESGGPVMIREINDVAAPLDRGAVTFQPGDTIRMDAVVRTRKIGHFFPGGTVDAFDVWLELIGTDATGKVVFWSGKVAGDGKGPVDPAAHFYRSYLLDGDSNHINKRNAWQARSSLYVRLIPPGAADTVHYKVSIPKDAKGPIQFQLKLNHRKFSHFYNEFAFTAFPDKTPVLPIVTIAEAKAKLSLGAAPTVWQPVVQKPDRERWNDWGIGMLLQGDIKGAEFAFKKVIAAEPEYADGYVNVARALSQEGETEAAKPYLKKALELQPNLARAHFFLALVQKADGDYDAALASLGRVVEQYPRDRVAQNQVARIQFLRRDYKASVEAGKRVLAIDPEDVQAHYTLMLAYRGLSDSANADREQKLFQRFKADEASQSITQTRRLQSREDNNERQMIHDHESAL
ncbi:MAG: tetratricopeptide repeat protein [Acidobacteria bacterium]|nr:tetratricopeptide repeat protein [Acidobacteriota bacterium]